ncbi:MAG: PKD domain-containing protein [Actinomycetota bacterium]|nr:PKD domain-containing protein [Actinomycetota bacterium]
MPADSPSLRRPIRYTAEPVPYVVEDPDVAICRINDTTWGWTFVVTAYDTVTGAVIGDRQITCVPIADPDAPAVPTAPTLPEPPTIGEIWNATNIPTPSLSTSPITDGVTGLETWLWATGPDTITVTTAPLNGYTVTGTATRTGYTFDFDDGPIQTSTTGGSEAEPAARHTYETKGPYTLAVTSTWTATFTMTGPGITTPLPIDTGTAHVRTTHNYRVVEIRGVLVG